MDRQTPSLLYHYTTIDTLIGILETNTVRATNISQMNDHMEFAIGSNRFAEWFSQNKTKSEKLNEIIDYISKILAKDTSGLYVVSFSERCDYLPQWRAYTSIGEGGVSIGFDLTKHKKYLGFGDNHPNEDTSDEFGDRLRICPCNYSKTGITDELVLKSLLDSTYAQLPGGLDSLMQVIHKSNQIRVSTKHSAYEEEKEWRGIVTDHLPPKNWENMGDHWHPPIEIDHKIKHFAIKLNQKKRKFIELMINPMKYIKEIWISPHGERKVMEGVINFFIDKDKLPDGCIRFSEIPFRTTNY